MPQAEALDNSIRGDLALNEEAQRQAADRLRQERRAAGDEAVAEAKQEGSLRERVMAARRALDIKERAKEKVREKVKEKVVMPVRMGTKWLLRYAWTSTASVIGFLPGILYINLHAFLHLVLPSFFCELGTEWMLGQLPGIMEKIKAAGIKIGEKMLLAFLDALLVIGFAMLFAVLKFIYDHHILSWALEKILF